MRIARLVSASLFFVSLSWGLQVGERGRTLKDTHLQSGTQSLLKVPKGTEFDVLAIEKTRQWVGTEITADETRYSGWLRSQDVQRVPKACATGYEYTCSEKEEVVCKSLCAPVCRMERVWVCKNTINPPGNGSPPYWPKPPGGSHCGYVKMKVCQNECTADCKKQLLESCSCTQMIIDRIED